MIRNVQRISKFFVDIYNNHFWVYGAVFVVFLSTLIAVRNISAFTLANFYAEDATVLYENIFSKDFFHTTLSAFNGYLIVGQYLLAYIAAGLNLLFGNNIVTLPIATAIVSCVFLGLAASLPFLLFREQLGVRFAIIVSILTALVPLKSYDYAIIGTISNLKFIFLYIAALLIIYRLVTKSITIKKAIIIDAFLLLCALTNATVAFLIPMVLLPYVPGWLRAIRSHQWRSVEFDFRQLSAVMLTILVTVYTLIAVMKGIPKIPGYLDGPFLWQSTLPLIDRSLFFALLYPITASFNNYFVGTLFFATIIGIIWLFLKKKNDRYIIAVSLWAIFLGTVLFVINRPGIGVYYLAYTHKGGPDQFFMAQNMVFIFMIAWLLREKVKSFNTRQFAGLLIGLVLYLLLALSHGSTFGASKVVYQQMGPIGPNVEKACDQYRDKKDVIIQIYPTPYWQWQVERSYACH